MRRSFIGYYRPTEEEFERLWESCYFVLDANVLLNLYRYSKDTADVLFGILNRIKERLWIPYQAALEYHERRIDVVLQQKKVYGDLLKNLKGVHDKLKSILEPVKRHPLIDVSPWLNEINNFFLKISEEIKNIELQHPDMIVEDPKKDKITEILEGKVGQPFSQEKIKEIYRIGEERYKDRIPPGYNDLDKEDERKFGDLIIWFEIIEHFKEKKKPVILITDEKKDDWWLKSSDNRIVGPRPELIKEMFEKAGAFLYIYQTEQFMELSSKYFNQRINQKAVEEVRNIKSQYLHNVKELSMLKNKHEQLYRRELELKMELDRMCHDKRHNIDNYIAGIERVDIVKSELEHRLNKLRRKVDVYEKSEGDGDSLSDLERLSEECAKIERKLERLDSEKYRIKDLLRGHPETEIVNVGLLRKEIAETQKGRMALELVIKHLEASILNHDI